jgi:serpin B
MSPSEDSKGVSIMRHGLRKAARNGLAAKRTPIAASLALAAVGACATLAGCAPPESQRDVIRIPDEPASSSPEDLAAQNRRFAFDLLRTVQTSDANAFFSPHSLSTAVGMVAAGARGPTMTQIADAMRWRLAGDSLHDSFAGLTRRLVPVTDSGGALAYEWNSANAIWPAIDASILPAFASRLETSYASTVTPTDYRDPAAAAAKINAWVDRQTRGRITTLVDEDFVRDQRLILTNAVYFKGVWREPFETQNTREEVFRLATGAPAEVDSANSSPRFAAREVLVPMMHDTRDVLHVDADGFSAISLPYVCGVSCVFILPDEGRLSDVAGSLDADVFDDAVRTMNRVEVEITLPKLNLRTMFSPGDALKTLGMRIAFTEDADFSGISSAERLMISGVVHAATIEMDEKGTVASAATGIGVAPTSIALPREKITFRADRPYFLAIRHDETGAILFLGRINDPRK